MRNIFIRYKIMCVLQLKYNIHFYTHTYVYFIKDDHINEDNKER